MSNDTKASGKSPAIEQDSNTSERNWTVDEQLFNLCSTQLAMYGLQEEQPTTVPQSPARMATLSPLRPRLRLASHQTTPRWSPTSSTDMGQTPKYGRGQ